MNTFKDILPNKLRNQIGFLVAIALTASNSHASQTSLLTTEKITGTWNGIYQCSAYPATFELTIKSTTGTQLHALIKRKQYRSNGELFPQANLPDIQLTGNFKPEHGTFFLNDANNAQRQSLNFQGVVDAKSNRFAAVINVPRESNCSYAVAGKNNYQKTVDEMLDDIPPHNERIPAQVIKNCDKHIADWLQQPTANPSPAYHRNTHRYGALELFEDEKFKPYFGKSYLDLTPKENIDLHLQVARTCWQTAQKAGSGSVLDVIRSQSRADLIVYGHSKDIVQQWRQHVLTSFNPQPSHSTQELVQSTQKILEILWPVEQNNIQHALAQKQFKQNNQTMMAALDSQIKANQKDFEGLLELAKFGDRILIGDAEQTPKATHSGSRSLSNNRLPNNSHQSTLSRREALLQERLQRRRNASGNLPNQSIDSPSTQASLASAMYVEPSAQTAAHSKTSGVINQHIKKATPAYLAKIMQPEEAILQLQPLDSGPYKALYKYLNADNKNWINQQLSARKSELTSQYANTEVKKFSNTLLSGTDNLVSLKQSTDYEHTLATRYGDLLSTPEFASFNQQRQQYRHTLIAKNSDALAKQVQSANSIKGIDSLITTYLHSNELNLPQAAPIKSAITTRKQVLAPFQGYPAADFLNAVYANDTQAVRTFNQQYIKKMQNSISGFLGSGDFRTTQLNTMASHISLMTPMVATYLFAYDRRYGRCLRDDAVEFTVTTHTPGSVTTNLLGVEIARTYGYSSAKNYKVNIEFSDIFRKIGTSNTGGVSGMLVDKLLSDGSVTDIRNGMEKVMASFDCDSDIIKSFEISMRHQFARL